MKKLEVDRLDCERRGMVSVVIPAKNEELTIAEVVQSIRRLKSIDEVLVVNDGSDDRTAEMAECAGAKVISHPYSKGNGAAVKTGALNARGDLIVFMDADGQHSANDIDRLLSRMSKGYDMVVGARGGSSQASLGRGLANKLYNRLASYMTGHRIEDLTSGFRVVRASRFREFLSLLPNGFSYPTTSTMAFFRAGYSVAYEPIRAEKRVGKSHIRIMRDGLRFLLIIFKIGMLYSPLKIFFPVAMLHGIIGIGYYAFTYISQGRLSLATVFMLTSCVTIFLIGLVSEQITQLIYQSAKKDRVE